MNLNVSELEENQIEDIGFIEDNVFYETKKPVNPKHFLKNVQEKKRKTINYDDILSSLNMKVIDGKLKIINPVPTINNSYINNNNNNNNYQKQYHTPIRTSKNHHLPIPIIQQPQIKKPLTRQEAILQYLKEQEERKRIREIKSTKLLYTTNNVNIAPIPSQNNTNTNINRFFRFMGK